MWKQAKLDLSDYIGPVVNVDEPTFIPGAYTALLYCPQCEPRQVSPTTAIAPPRVVMQVHMWTGTLDDGTVIVFGVWMGRCPECGTVCQSWKLLHSQDVAP